MKGPGVVIRTRTGTDEDPNVYWWDTGRGAELSTLKVNGEPLNLNDYRKVPNTQRGPITYDTENWSFWSPPYDFDRGFAGVPVGPPLDLGATSSFAWTFFPTITDGSRIEAIGFDFSKPPSARTAVAEIFPRQVEAAVDTTFTYFLRPILDETDLGFDSLEIDTFVRPARVRSVRIEGEAVDLDEYPPEILDDRLVVHFPRFGPQDTQKLLEVVFDVRGGEIRYRVQRPHLRSERRRGTPTSRSGRCYQCLQRRRCGRCHPFWQATHHFGASSAGGLYAPTGIRSTTKSAFPTRFST